MPPSNSKMSGHQMEHVFYEHPEDYYESYPQYEHYDRNNPPRFDIYHRNAPLSNSRKYALPDSAYNFIVGGEESNVRSYNKSTDKSQNAWRFMGGRGKSYHPRKSSTWHMSSRSLDWELRESPQNDASSPLTFTTSSDSMSGSDSGSKYKNQTNSSQDHDSWYGKKHSQQSLMEEIDRKNKNIHSLHAKIEMLESDKERRSRQLSSTKKQVMSKHHKLSALKTQMEKLNHQMDLLKDQLLSIQNDNMEKVQVLAEQSKQFAEAKEIYHNEVENLKMQLRVSKQLIAQKDEYFRKNGEQFQSWNSELTQKNNRLTQKLGILEQSNKRALQNIKNLNNRNQNLQIEKEALNRTNKNLQETEREHKAQIALLTNKLSGWAVSAASSETEVYTQSGSESEDNEGTTASNKRIIPGECVPGFIFDESKLSKEDRTIKYDRRLRKQLKYSYKEIPIIPSGSVLKQIFQIGCKFVHPDLLKKSADGLVNKSHPKLSDSKEKPQFCSVDKKHPLYTEEKPEPQQPPCPKSLSKNVNVTVLEKQHVVGQSHDGEPEDSNPSPKGVNSKN